MFGFSDKVIYPEAAPYEKQLAILREKLAQADAVLVGAGAGLSTAAGLSYGGARFQKYFADFATKRASRSAPASPNYFRASTSPPPPSASTRHRAT